MTRLFHVVVRTCTVERNIQMGKQQILLLDTVPGYAFDEIEEVYAKLLCVP